MLNPWEVGNKLHSFTLLGVLDSVKHIKIRYFWCKKRVALMFAKYTLSIMSPEVLYDNTPYLKQWGNASACRSWEPRRARWTLSKRVFRMVWSYLTYYHICTIPNTFNCISKIITWQYVFYLDMTVQYFKMYLYATLAREKAW